MTSNTVVVVENQTTVVDNSGPTAVTIQTATIQVISVGIQGPQGPGTNTRMGTVFIAAPANGTIPLISYSEYGFTILGLDNLQVASGSLTLSILINGVPVTGLSNISVTTTPQSVAATALNAVNVGDRVTMAIANAAGQNLEFTMKGTI